MISRGAGAGVAGRILLFIVTRTLRCCIVVPAVAFVLHFAQPQFPWWSWCGVASLSLGFIWCVDGALAFRKWVLRRRAPVVYAAPPTDNDSYSASLNSIAAAATLDSRCGIDEVPGIGMMTGERCRSQASAI